MLGAGVGAMVGMYDGLWLGAAVGSLLGTAVGSGTGMRVGFGTGTRVGSPGGTVGIRVLGYGEGSSDGKDEGSNVVGWNVVGRADDGWALGRPVGCPVVGAGTGTAVGARR